ncbi:hypothetical protein HDV05_006730, partial [Chytridiales sp. JEL 0842]
DSHRAESVVFSPYSSLIFISPVDRPSQYPTKLEYTHELLAVTYSGIVKSYRFNLDEILAQPLILTNDLATAGTITAFWRHAVTLQPGNASACGVTLHHLCDFKTSITFVTSALYDPSRRVLLLAGATSSEPSSTTGFTGITISNGSGLVTSWKLDSAEPYYLPVDPSGQPLSRTAASNIIVLKNLDDCSALASSGWMGLAQSVALDLVSKMMPPLKAKMEQLASDTVVDFALSPAGGHLCLVLSASGALALWNRNEMKRLNVWSAEDISTARRKEIMDTSAGGTATLKVERVGWWSKEYILLQFNDGWLLVADVSNPEKVLLAEHFAADLVPQVLVLPGDRIFALETETRKRQASSVPPQESSATLQAPGYIIRTLMNTISSPPTQSTLGLLPLLKPPTNVIMHHLISLNQTTPMAALRLSIRSGEYGTALDICHKYGLDVDEVYKARWRDSDFGEAAIHDFLSVVKDKEWVLTEALERVPGNAKSARALLKFVVKQTDHVTQQDVEAEIEEVLLRLSDSEMLKSESNKSSKKILTSKLCSFRMKALKYLDRLETFDSIHGTRASNLGAAIERLKIGEFTDRFRQFRDADLVSLACRHASKGNTDAMEVFFTRHGSEVLPYRLAILSLLPLTIDPTAIKKVLPRIDVQKSSEVAWHMIPWRKPDWTEASSVVQELLFGFESEEDSNDEVNVKLVAVEHPASAEVVGRWYVNRVLEIEMETCQADLALEFGRLVQGSPFHVSGLEDVLKALETLVDLVYGCQQVSLSLAQLQKLGPEEVLGLLLDDSRPSPSEFVNRARKYAIPFLDRVQQQDALCAYLKRIFSSHTQTCAKVFECSRSTVDQHQRILKSDTQLAEMILEFAYSSDSIPVDILQNVFRSLPDLQNAQLSKSADSYLKESDGWDEDGWDVDEDEKVGASSASEPAADSLLARLISFERHLDALEILQKYGINVSLAYFQSSDSQQPTAQKSHLVRMSRSLVDQGVDFDDDEWSDLYEDLVKACTLGIFGAIDQKEVTTQFISVVLAAGHFELVKDIISKDSSSFSSSFVEKIIVDCARELFDNADSANMNTGMLQQAVHCLQIIPATPQVNAELDLIEATHSLSCLYASLAPSHYPAPLPIQVRLHKDRLDLIASLLDRTSCLSNSEYKALVDVSRKLVASKDPKTLRSAETRVRGMVANWAVDNDDIETAVKVVKEMIQQNTSAPVVLVEENEMTMVSSPAESGSVDDAWRVCIRIVREAGTMIDTDLKRRLVGFALEYCEPYAMSEVLDVSKAIDIETSSGLDNLEGVLVSGRISDFVDALKEDAAFNQLEGGESNKQQKVEAHWYYGNDDDGDLDKFWTSESSHPATLYSAQMMQRHRELLWKKKSKAGTADENDELMMNLANE